MTGDHETHPSGAVVTAPTEKVPGSATRLSGRLQEALSGEAGIEGVCWVLGGRPIRRIIREELRGLLSNPSHLGPCVLRRAKFKPGRKLTAYYDVGLATGAGPARSIAVTWQPEGSSSLSSEDPSEVDLESEALAGGVAAPFSRLSARDPHLGMRILVAPLDAAYPQLVRVSSPDHVADLVTRLMEDAAGGSSPELPSAVDVTAVRYRPGQRHVLRYDCLAPDGRIQRGETLFAKLYNDGEDIAAFRVATGIADWVSSSTEASAIRPLAHLSEDGLIIYPELAGTPLSHHPAARAAKPLAQAGAVLRALQRAPVGLFDDVRPHSFAGEARAVARAAEHVRPLFPAAGAAIDRILERAAAVEARLPGESPVLAHGDYKADHVWVGRTGITLIDFNTCSLADPALDLGKFLADLHWWYAAGGEEQMLGAQRNFLEGYGHEIEPVRLLRARLYEVLILTKITVRRVRLFDRRWASKTDGLLRRAEGLLGDLETAISRSGREEAATARAGR
ncbi:MAG TPA: aminoglycoside phosphotransferase family protein [Actinomycetota bacterium]|nr:aminoglycoside phosphotransferase family protein [Actinomycetota bacterium]